MTLGSSATSSSIRVVAAAAAAASHLDFLPSTSLGPPANELCRKKKTNTGRLDRLASLGKQEILGPRNRFNAVLDPSQIPPPN